MALALTAAHLLGKLAGVPGRLATLIGVGTAVCGNSAIVATAPVIRALDEEVSFAVATNTLFGTAAVLLYPIIGRALHFSDHVFGTWAGTAVNDTSQVVAAGFAYSEAAGRLATAVKLNTKLESAFQNNLVRRQPRRQFARHHKPRRTVRHIGEREGVGAGVSDMSRVL